MGISQLKNCIGYEEESKIANRFSKLTLDYQHFQQQKWYTFQNPMLFDPNKFIFLYPNYEEEQLMLIGRWKKVIDIKKVQFWETRHHQEEALSTRWKFAINRGLPIAYFPRIISVIFNKNFQQSSCNQTYQKLKTSINYGESVPLFGHQERSIKKSIHSPFLNDKGFQSLKKLFYLFKQFKGQFFYCKYLGHVTALFLIFFKDCQTFEFISTMLEESSNMSFARTQSLKWHFILREEQLNSLAQNYYHKLRKNSTSFAKVQNHFQRYNIDKVGIFKKIVENFFYGFVPFPMILQLFVQFLNEGIQILLRVFYGILIFSQKQIFHSTTDEKILYAIRNKCLNLNFEEIHYIFKNAMNLNMNESISERLIESRVLKQNYEKKYYFLPLIKGASNILSFNDLEALWHFLPFQLKNYDLEMVYPCFDNEYRSLSRLLKSFERSIYNLIVIKTKSGASFGIFIYGKISDQQKSEWFGSDKNFLFDLSQDKLIKYASSRQNRNYIYRGKNYISVGTGKLGSSLKLTQKLDKVESHPTQTYYNDNLTNNPDGIEEIEQIEAFKIY